MSGLLHFRLTKAKSYKYIEIRLYGGAQVRWSETHRETRHVSSSWSGNMHGSTETRTHTVTYQSKETYIHEARILWSRDQSPQGKIGPETFDLPFQFLLPPNCLSSFQGSVGSVSYILHGLIKTGLLHQDHKIQTPIQVSKVTDINIPQLLMPVHQSKKKHVGFFCFGRDVEFKVSLNRTGFCIGHNLPLTVSVVNGSSRHIKIRASIWRFTHYYAQGHAYHDRESKMVSVTTPDVAPQSEQIVNIEDLIVPMVLTSICESQIIKMQYFLKVEAVIPWAINSSVMIPITLGNVPLNNDKS